MDQINESVDIIVQYGSNNHSDHIQQMIKLPQLNFISKRPLYSIEQRNILLIRQYFKDKNCLLLPTYATMNKMYLCNKIEMDQKIAEHFMQTKAYTLIQDCTDMNQDDLQTLFNVIIHRIDSKLFNLFNRCRITIKQYGQMLSVSKRDENQINSMIFLPDTRTEIVSFRPMLLNASGPINYISQYLYQYLQSSYCFIAHSTTFNNGMDVVKAVETFSRKGFLQTNTQFVTLEIKDFDIIFSHEQIIEILKRFLSDHISNRLTTTSYLSNKTIIRLVRLVLSMQYFMYDDKLYQQTKGSHPDSSLTKLLVNIYLFYWQQDLMQFLKRRKELFGRSFNKMFFTWKGPKRTFFTMFNKIKENLPDLPIQVSIGTSIHYLDVEIIQYNGILRTKVYRSSLTEPYTVPYLINYPLDQYATRIRNHLIHAIQSCTNIEDFQDEHLFIYSICLFNRFPLDFIVDCVNKFFNEFNPSKLNYQYDQQAYTSLRQCVMTTNVQMACLPMNNKRSRPNDDLNNERKMKRLRTE